MYRANDTFVVELDGSPRRVNKGDVLMDTDAVVRHDISEGGGLFTRMNYGEDEPVAAPKTRGRRPTS